MLKYSELSLTYAPKRTVTGNALPGYDRVLPSFKIWQILFGLAASENTLLHNCTNQRRFCCQC